RHVERIEPHVGMDRFNRPVCIPRPNESDPETPVHIVWIEGHGFFEGSDGSVVLMLAEEDVTERGMCLGQISIQLHGLAREFVPALKKRALRKSSSCGLCQAIT